MIRHGDVIIEKVCSIPSEAKILKGRKEIAYGEVTGHAHRIDIGDLFETKEGDIYLKTNRLTNLTHEEHKKIKLQPGIYKCVIKRQYTPSGWENVRD